ncbi:MAG: hypothetical protein ACYDHH_14370 [Solirubrobacteraceae bacterium]
MHWKLKASDALRRGTALLSCGAIVLAVSACGSSSKSSSHTKTTAVATTASSTPTNTTPTNTTPTSTSGTTSTTGTSTGPSTGATGAVTASAYAKRVLALTTTFRTASTKFASANTTGSLDSLASSSKAYGVASGTFANALGKLTPPATIANAQTLLVRVLHDFSKDLAKLGKDAAVHDIAAIKADTTAISALEPRLAAAQAAIVK